MDNQVSDMRRIKEQAIEWLLLLSAEKVSDEESRRFDRWLAADARHKQAYCRMAQISAYMSEAEMMGDSDVESAYAEIARANAATEMRGPQRKRQFTWGIAAMAACLVVAVGLLTSSLYFGQTKTLHYTTQVAELRDIELMDGSIVSLGANSDLAVHYSDAERRVELISGEAFFSVARDTLRPFWVIVGKTEIVVIGTQFNVNRSSDGVRIGVAEGVVEVSPAETASVARDRTPPQKVVLTKGQGVRAHKSGELSGVRELGLQVPGAWRSGRLVYEDAALWEIISDMKRYYPGGIEIASEEIGKQRISVAFDVDQIRDVVLNLELGLPIDVVERGERLILFARKTTPQ